MINDMPQSILGIKSPQTKGGRDSSTSRISEAQEIRKPEQTGPSGSTAFNISSVSNLDDVADVDRKLDGVVDDLNQYAQAVKRQLQFSVDDDSGKTIVKVLDAETGDTIREIPAEEVLSMQKRLQEVSDMLFKSEESATSLLFSEKA